MGLESWIYRLLIRGFAASILFASLHSDGMCQGYFPCASLRSAVRGLAQVYDDLEQRSLRQRSNLRQSIEQFRHSD